MSQQGDPPGADRAAPPQLAGSGERAAAAFYLALAREAGGPVLELGCGRGERLLEIARAGFPCSGVDGAAEPLAELRRRGMPPSLRLARAPLSAFDLGSDRFTLIYAAGHALAELGTPEERLRCLACVRRHLAPGGITAFDLLSAEPQSPELRARCRLELAQLLARAGLGRAEFYGDFQRGAARTDNGFVVVARSPAPGRREDPR